MGRIYLIGGSRGMVGAVILSAVGALRAGAGLVRVGIVKSQQRAVVLRAPLELTTDALPEGKSGRLSGSALAAIRKAVARFAADVLGLGPGLGQDPAVRKVVGSIVRAVPKTLVLDADGLNAFAGTNRLKHHAGALIITPHEGELARLLNRPVAWIHRHREEAALTAARRFGCVCLLKGTGSLVTDGTVIWKNPTGNPGMASGGMGDVLTGIVAAFAARLPPLKAAALGAYVHGSAADLAAQRISKAGFLASDLAGFIPQAIGRI